MSVLGELVKGIRFRSTYRDVGSFASEAGLSYEGLRKIEAGERIPSVETAESIIRVGQLPVDAAAEFRHARNRAHAQREGIDLYAAIPQADMERLAKAAVDVIAEYLDGCEPSMGFPDDLVQELTDLIVKKMRKELSG